MTKRPFARTFVPLAILGFLALLPWLVYKLQSPRTLDLVVVDKTVPYVNRIEHRSLFWLFNHKKLQQPDGRPFDTSKDYLGAFPGPIPGDPPAETTAMTPERARQADLVYFADTYGVYREDLESGPAMLAALERSPKIYGGMTMADVEAAEEALAVGNPVVSEFNSLGSPTSEIVRKRFEGDLGVRWTHWIGRFFPDLANRKDVPEWVRRNYRQEWKREWLFEGPGYVLLYEDAHVEVLRIGPESDRIGLTIERTRPIDPLLEQAGDKVPYPYWFDIITADPSTNILARFHWHLTPAGLERLAARRLPVTFPAVTRRKALGRADAFYFAGDFADNPMNEGAIPLAGYPIFRRWLERVRLTPSEDAFYWRFYVPMVSQLLDNLPPHREGTKKKGAPQ